METDVTWEQWTKMLRTGINIGEFIGLSEDRIKGMSYRMGGFLAGHIDSGNREQRLLQELWLEGTEEERRGLTSMLVKMLERDDKRDKEIVDREGR
ncbi:MAG: DUF3243 family protein [Desulforudis sp.]|jgi:hypothetical protein|nr:DUF3243 family protein [Clostridia bacterium]MDQ7791155.1 DUF3243 family protein [Clostridia bacterium]RJX17802.1 MAG: DUF3243 family protein [Desulforudis sp.]